MKKKIGHGTSSHLKGRQIASHPAKKKSVHTESRRLFPIVGIGASAGGLEAVSQLLQHLPADTGMAFVLVQHLDPTHESSLCELLTRNTSMPVTQVKNGAPIEANRVYVIPPNKLMKLRERRLHISPRLDGNSDRMPVDYFFHSLAEEEKDHSIGIVLSGNGTDGTNGLLAIKSAGGITFAQSEKSAKFSSMPASAVATDCVDFVLPLDKMAQELELIAHRLPQLSEHEHVSEETSSRHERAFEEILVFLRHRMAVDFTQYKHATLRRRIERRMLLHKLESLKEYCDFLRKHPDEVKELFNDILIHVTGFFRDTAVFQTLKKKIFPRLIRGKGHDETIRIWIPGCSTGEEVYSVAMVMTELMNGKKMHRPVQIFGTDINENALERARAGVYPENIQTEISPERLRRFFTRCEGGFRVNKTIREMCIFARQNLTVDPPFSNLDLVSCRNVLIYLGPTLQRKVLPVFHYALRSTGLLMLGASETIGSFADLFSLVDKKAKVYSKRAVQSRPSVTFANSLPATKLPSEGELPHSSSVQVSPGITEVQKHADRIILTNHSPAGVVINQHFEVLQFRGRTGPYLEHPHGEANLSLFKMAREGLLLDLRALVNKVVKQNIRARQDHIRVKQNGHYLECSIEAIPFSVPPTPDRFYLILFESKYIDMEGDGRKSRRTNQASTKAQAKAAEAAQIDHLQEELSSMRESMQAVIEEQEATNEELRSANEEIMSSNEELQSTNEELETAKEELQSTNEELTTLNDELESRNSELQQVNNDLHNLLASVSIPVIILNSDLRIRRFTAAAEKMFKLIPGDIGRPITDINVPLEIPNLEADVLEVLDTLAPKDLELTDKRNHWWSVRIRAYKTMENKIDGVVIALVDIDMIRSNAEHKLRSHSTIETIINTISGPLLVLDDKLTVAHTNSAFLRVFGKKRSEVVGQGISDFSDGQWSSQKFRSKLEDVLRHQKIVDGFEVEYDLGKEGKKKLYFTAHPLAVADSSMILLSTNKK